MNKKLYEVPESELVFVKYEDNIMSPTFNEKQHTEYLGEEEDGGLL